MKIESILQKVCENEIVHNCYNYKILNIPIYTFIRRDIRKEFINQAGEEFVESQKVGSIIQRVFSLILSTVDLLFIRRKYKYLFHTFRLERINDVYLDRFIDPFIECSAIKNSFIICETNKGRLYPCREHKDNIVYDDVLVFLSKICTFIFAGFYINMKYKYSIDPLFEEIRKFVSISEENKKKMSKDIVENIFRVKLYIWLIKKLDVQYVISASRSSFMPLLCAAKIKGVKVYELQHGIVNGLTVSYGGYNDVLFTPDMFLGFQNIHNILDYGISKDKYINIGYAFFKYIKNRAKLIDNSIHKGDILVLSQPDKSDFIIENTICFAKKHSHLKFVYRCHPLERLSDRQLHKLLSNNNISLQDSKISSIVALMLFDHIICVQSSVIFEALSLGKQIGILSNRHENACFENEFKNIVVIDSEEKFDLYLRSAKKLEVHSAYSEFNKNVIDELLK